MTNSAGKVTELGPQADLTREEDFDLSATDSSFVIENESRVQRISREYLKPNVGLVLLVISQFFNSCMVVSTKVLETEDVEAGEEPIKPLQILLVRMLITYLGTLIYMYLNRASIKNVPFGAPPMRKWLALRGFTGFFGVFGMYFSLLYLSISDAVLITFLTPTVTVILAWVVLREKLTRLEVIGSIVSLAGVVLIVRPSFLFGILPTPEGSVESEDPRERLIATIVALVGVLGASAVYIIIRFIGDKAHAILSVSYFSLIVTIISFVGILVIPSMSFQVPKNLKQWLLFGNLGICGFIFQLLLTLGIQKERAGRGSLMSYTQLIYAVFWDVSLWHHWPSFWSWLGMFVILTTTVVVGKFKPRGDATAATRDQETQQVQADDDQVENIPLEELSK